MLRPKFWTVTFDRAIRTAAQFALLALGLNITEHDDLPMLDAFATDWTRVGSYALGGAILTVLGCIVWTPKELEA